MVVGAINAAYRGYKTIKRGYQTYNRYNQMYNPVAKFETRLPPGYRKPYRIGLRIGDAILAGGLIYDISKDLFNDFSDDTASPPGKIQKQFKTYKPYKTRRRQTRCSPGCYPSKSRYNARYRYSGTRKY